jgi:hypothetical protein
LVVAGEEISFSQLNKQSALYQPGPFLFDADQKDGLFFKKGKHQFQFLSADNNIIRLES